MVQKRGRIAPRLCIALAMLSVLLSAAASAASSLTSRCSILLVDAATASASLACDGAVLLVRPGDVIEGHRVNEITAYRIVLSDGAGGVLLWSVSEYGVSEGLQRMMAIDQVEGAATGERVQAGSLLSLE